MLPGAGGSPKVLARADALIYNTKDMVFSSFEFLGVFLPLFLVAYFLTCRYARVYRNTVIFLFSIAFYAYGAISSGTPLYLLLILVSVVFNYEAGLIMPRLKKGPKTFVFIIGLILDFGVLIVF